MGSCARVWPYKLYSENALLVFLEESSFFTPRHTSHKLSSKEGSTEIENFLNPGKRIIIIHVGRGHIVHLVKIHKFFSASCEKELALFFW